MLTVVKASYLVDTAEILTVELHDGQASSTLSGTPPFPEPYQAAYQAWLDAGNQPSHAGATLPQIKARLSAEIDARAEAERLRYITPGYGQALTYLRKVEEARMADAETNPDPADYPLLAASVGIDAPDIGGVADLVLAMDQQWTAIGAAIETTRLAAKRAVSEATDEETAQALMEAISWPSPG